MAEEQQDVESIVKTLSEHGEAIEASQSEQTSICETEPVAEEHVSLENGSDAAAVPVKPHAGTEIGTGEHVIAGVPEYETAQTVEDNAECGEQSHLVEEDITAADETVTEEHQIVIIQEDNAVDDSVQHGSDGAFQQVHAEQEQIQIVHPPTAAVPPNNVAMDAAEDEDVEYDMDEPALLLTDKGKLYICIYCGMVSVFVTHLRSHLKVCRQKNTAPVLEIPTLETILCKINDRIKQMVENPGAAEESQGNEELGEKEQQIADIVERSINCIVRKSEKKKRSCSYCARAFYSSNGLKKHMEEQCPMRPESDSDDEVRMDPSGEMTVLPLTITPLGDVCECDHQDEFTRAADMLVDKLLKRTNEIYFQGVCGNIFKVEAGRRKRRVKGGSDGDAKQPRLDVEVDENGDPCGKFPCPLCKVVLFESHKLDEHLKSHVVKDATGRCDYCHSSFPTQQLRIVEKSS